MVNKQLDEILAHKQTHSQQSDRRSWTHLSRGCINFRRSVCHPR